MPRLGVRSTESLSRLCSIAGDPHAPARVPVGDAAFSLDPLSAHGLVHALASGRPSTEAVRAHLDGDRDVLARHRAGAHALFQRQFPARQRYYAQESRWPHSPFWRRGREDALWAFGEVSKTP